MSITGNVNGQNRNETFGYDDLGRLVTASGWNWQRRYGYDRWGNRTGVWDATSGGSQIQSITLQQPSGVTNNRVATVNGTGYIYDVACNLTSDGTHSYQYDGEGRLAKVDAGT